MKLMLGDGSIVEATDDEIVAFERAGYTTFDPNYAGGMWRVLPTSRWPEVDRRVSSDAYVATMGLAQRMRPPRWQHLDSQAAKQMALKLINEDRSFSASPSPGGLWTIEVPEVTK
jgi:hypothetical protein